MAENNQQSGAPEKSEDVPVFSGIPDRDGKRISPLAWVGTVNFAQGFQYAIVIQLFIIIFKTMGVPNGPAVFWASFLSLPWSFKPLWGPLIDRYWTKRNWTITMQFVIGVCLMIIAVGFILPESVASLIPQSILQGYQPFFIISVIFLTIMGFAAATHDIACDGFYMLALNDKQQGYFVGFRSTAFRIALILVNGAIVLIAYSVQESTGPPPNEVQVVANAPVQAASSDESEDEVIAVEEEIVENPLVVLGEVDHLSASTIAIRSDVKKETRQIVFDETVIDADLNTTSVLENGVGKLIVKGQPVGGPRDEEHYFDGEPTEDLKMLVDTDSLEAVSGEETRVFVNITKEPAQDEIIAVTVRIKPTGNVLYRILFPSDSKGMGKDRERLEFTADNWREGQPVTFTMPKMQPGQEPIAVTYQVASGNIALSWAITLGFCGLMYFLFVALHYFFMPRPFEDTGGNTTTPFIIPLMALIIAIGVPLYLLGVLKGGYELSRSSLEAYFLPGEDISETAKKGFDFAFHTIKWILVLGIPALLIKYIKPIRDFCRKFMKSMSDISEIGFYDVFGTFFTKKGIGVTLAFLLTFRLGEAQLAQLKTPFLIDPIEDGGLGLSLGLLAYVNTVYYLVPLTVGGILSGIMIGYFGLRKMIWPCVFFMHAPNALYILLASGEPSQSLINSVVTAEAFGYGFGFAAYLMVMIIAAQGAYKTSHYALCTGVMAIGYMIPGLWAGFLQDITGYQTFFVLVVIFSLPGLLFIPFLPIDEDFGKKKEENEAEEQPEES